MIICSTVANVIIGRTYEMILYDAQEKPHTVRATVLRRASKEDYLAWCEETGANMEVVKEWPYYYEIITD